MKNFFKKKSVRIISIVLVVLIIVSTVLVINLRNKKKSLNNISYIRTVVLSKSSLMDTVVASGNIESQTTSTITSSVNNATVSKINYSVGDYVKEGDVIIELDTTNLNKQITKIENNLQDVYDDAVSSKDSAWSTFYSAQQTYNSANSAFSAAKNSIAAYQSDYNTKENARRVKAEECYAASATCYLSTYDNYIVLKDAAEKAKDALDKAKQSVNYDELEKTYNSAYEAYTKAQSALSQANSKVADAEENLNGETDNDQLEELYDTVADYKLKAKSTGQITSINAVLGSSTNGTLATIQDTSKLKISLTIDEYDILNISLGMKATIETDASDTVYEGEVSQISPVASTGTMGSSGGFEIEVNITSIDVTGLLIGMNAEVTIIISSGDENYTVPIDAVETKDDGTSVIYVKNDDGDFEEVTVTTGNTSGYYIEIFGDSLQDGMVVRASANADEAEISEYDEEDNFEEGGFNFGGFGGGNVPGGRGSFSGGDMPSGGGPSGGNFPGGR